MSGPRVLTFNFHEPYLWLMAKTGLDFTVGQYDSPALAREWHLHYRPIPKNMTLVDERTWRENLAANRYDVVIAQNETNAADLYGFASPKIVICHNRRTFLETTVVVDKGNPKALYDELIRRLRARFGFVFISESKRADYGLPGDVILPGIDVEEFGGYTGEKPEVLRVGNLMRARNLMFDVDFQEKVCEGFPNLVLGADPTISNSRESESFEDLVHCFRSFRCLLHVTREEYEDGYNLSTLEAMACGMPVVSLANKTSPITDGQDGFVSYDAEVLRSHIQDLFDDRDAARAIGEKGRETVARKFPIKAFVENWTRVIERAAEGSTRSTRRRDKEAQAHPTGIVMHYVSSPITTGRYWERAARKRYPVVTAGFRCPEDVLAVWGFPMPYPSYPAQQIDLPMEGTCAELMARLPDSFEPDLYLWIDSGPSRVPADVGSLAGHKACYLIDTHISPELRIAMAEGFDTVFLAQKTHLEMFKQAGIKRVFWLPLACSPELHAVNAEERIYDVAYVGSLKGDPDDRRSRLLDDIGRRFPNSVIGQFWPEEMARLYVRSKIVVNACVRRDLNMRVFEAMASGAMLITDEADGLEELFEDGKHLVIYRGDAELPELVEKYLRDDVARERIAREGATLVRNRHTYDRRLEEMMTACGFHRRSERRSVAGDQRFGAGGYYRNIRPELAQHVPLSTRRLLDVGCGCGDFAANLKKQGVKEVYGIEIVEQAWNTAKQVLDDAILGNIEQMELPFEEGFFDCIVCGDVLEHLVNPAAALKKLDHVLAPEGVIVMSIPNVRFYEVIAMLGNGRWQYMDAGILDRTHLRFFTAVEMRQLVEEAGMEALHVGPLSIMQEDQVPRAEDGSIQLGRVTIHPQGEDDFRDLLTYQYLVIAGKPNVDRLARARSAFDLGQNEAAYILAIQALGVDEFERKGIMARAMARIGQLAKAETLCSEALELRPADPELRRERGLLLSALGRPLEARSYLDESLGADPDDAQVLAALGIIHAVEGRPDVAFGLMLKALEASYENKACLPHFIRAAEALDRLPDAKDLLRRYADFYPGSPDIGCQYAELLIRLGEMAEARDCLETLLMLSPDAQEARKLLESLGENS